MATKKKVARDPNELQDFNFEMGTERTPEEVARAFPRKKQTPPPQNIKMIPLEVAIQVITNWWDKDPTFHWEKTPAWVINKLLEAVDDDVDDGQPLLIPYAKAVSILKQAETTKMDGPANKGMRYIQDEWKKLYLP